MKIAKTIKQLEKLIKKIKPKEVIIFDETRPIC